MPANAPLSVSEWVAIVALAVQGTAAIVGLGWMVYAIGSDLRQWFTWRRYWHGRTS